MPLLPVLRQNVADRGKALFRTDLNGNSIR